jgi:superfamily II DNA or RNA helicase
VQFKQVALASHLYLPLKEMSRGYREDLCYDLTVTPKFGEDRQPVLLYDESKAGWLGVPLYHFSLPPTKMAKEVRDIRVKGRPARFKFTSTLRPGQVPVMEEFARHLKAGKTGFILEADPGFGKTVMLLNMMEMIGLATLIIVPRSNLVRQWKERILEHTDIKRSEIGWVNGPQVLWRGKKVVVALVHSIALDRLGRDFKTYFGCVIPDEVDRSIPPATFAPVLSMFPAMYRIGATATVERQDGMDVVFKKHLGQVHLHGEAEPGETMKPTVVLHEYDRSSGKVPSHLGSMQRRGILLSRLAKDAARNLVLAKYIKLLYNSDRRIVVLSDRVEHLQLLRALVDKKHGIALKETGLYVDAILTGLKTASGKPQKRHTSEAEIERVARTCKVIFATYQKFAIGTDIQDLAGLVYATPQSEVVQSKGRIERFQEDKKYPIVVDMLDLQYPETKRWANKRLAHYRSKGMTIKRLR